MTSNCKILIVTFPGQGLINPSLRFANRLVKMGVDVTFCTSQRVTDIINKEITPKGVTYAPLFDGHNLVIGKKPTSTFQQFLSDFATKGTCAVAEIICSAADKGQPFDHVVYTTMIPWVAHVAKAHGVKSTLLWCQPAIILDIYYYYFNGYEKLISSNNNNPMFPLNLPGLPPLTMADMPSFFLKESGRNDHEFILSIYKEHIDVLKTAPRILINTFNELEAESMKAIENIQFLPIGPLDEKDAYGTPDESYVNWLNTKPKKSVVYVSFGSVARLSSDQAEEMAIGLLNSGRPFLWVIRDEEEATKLSKIHELKKQGMIVQWCCQVEVLGHEAIGCFVTSCGWNSTLEALAAGVHMVAYPQWSDQGTNAKMIEDVWKVGVRVGKKEGNVVVEGKEIERCVQKVMGDEKISVNVLKWKNLAKKVVEDGGLSTSNLKSFVVDV
ncbi:UDP-glycosyltransferase 75C1-like [Rutidosis leptorrhynchoides]|uniref:UDP-glycosyltransferase 75C1-like n=1 Tax=Rutidosis leptorrhynchoides TaxID=125765 RepID=UPI003A9A09B6